MQADQGIIKGWSGKASLRLDLSKDLRQVKELAKWISG